MTVTPIFTQTGNIRSNATSLLVKADAEFLSKLTLGQIIKGRVLRSYDSNRYLVDFYGQEKVVDSAVPLRDNELLHGKVVGLGERVELHKVNGDGETASPGEAPEVGRRVDVSVFSSPAGRIVGQLFERYNAVLDPAQARMLERFVARAADADQMALSGLVLTKLGMQLSPELLNALYLAMTPKVRSALFPLPTTAIRLERASTNAVPNDSVEGNDTSAAALAEALQWLSMQLPETRWRVGRNPPKLEGDPIKDTQNEAHLGTRDPGWFGDGRGCSLARWLLNAQTGGTIAHRVSSLPILIDGELVELDLAMFEQTGDAQTEYDKATAYRQIVVALDTRNLGRVEIVVAIAGTHMRLTTTTDSSAATQFMADHAEPLIAALGELGWEIDEINYQTGSTDTINGVLRSVVEHIVSPGSVSRLV